ncbi:MAG: hypothetical protein GF383_15105 [Candidatus Lokiarchaeota archaeon]|nr:hypothetical protein [Candidatus Lokiarchaeota archaeon]MBD3342844.1 hypothetical protein [Candidatus Lokiarchaeota archaeon]
MKLSLTDLNNGTVFIGDNLTVRTNYLFEEDTSILWSGLRLITHPPCSKELQIAKAEIFPRGVFEAGEYLRDRAILIKNNVVPTIKKRDLEYSIQMILRKKNPMNPDDDIMIKKENNVEIRVKKSQLQQKKPNPVSFTISGLHIELTKDIFKPGETIKVNYTSEGLREIEVRLLQKANLICYCDAYGKNCRKVEELPPAIAGDVKTRTNTDKGYMLLKVPEIAEPSHNYLWEPSEKEHWGFKYGDYSEWSLLVIGKRRPEFGREPIKFDFPITITSAPITEKKIEEDLFSSEKASARSLFNGVSSKFQKTFKVVSVDSDLENLEKYKVKIKNTSKNNLKGVTVKITGLQEGLFETAPSLRGFKEWSPEEVKEINYESKQNISAIISYLEDNDNKRIRIQTPVASDFF